jgi:hypothetical protein
VGCVHNRTDPFNRGDEMNKVNWTQERVITQGLDPGEEPLDFPMSCWQISESDFEDLLDYLKSLE